MNDDLSEEELDRRWELRIRTYKNIVREQFELAYYGRVDYKNSEVMSITERKILYDLLVKTKKEEKEAHEKALAEAKEKSSRGGKRSKRHR